MLVAYGWRNLAALAESGIDGALVTGWRVIEDTPPLLAMTGLTWTHVQIPPLLSIVSVP